MPQRRVSDLGFVGLSSDTMNLIKNLFLGVVYGSDNRPVLSELAKGCDGVIGSGLVDDACGVCDGDNSTCCRGTPQQVAQYCFPCQYTPDQP